MGGSEFTAELQAMFLDNIVINSGNYSFPALVQGCTPSAGNFVYLGLRTGGFENVTLNFNPARIDQLQLYAPGAELHYVARSSASWMMLLLDLDELQSIAARTLGRELDWPAQGVKYLDLSSKVSNLFKSDLHSMFVLGRNLSDASAGIEEVALLKQGLMQSICSTIASSEFSRGKKRPISRARLHALISLENRIKIMKTQAGSLSVSEIGGICERTLQMATREAYGMTPNRWIRLTRLNSAFNDLNAGLSESQTVTSVCHHWGFNHMGRFAIEYKKLFGESPHVTLARAKERGNVSENL